MKFAIHTQTLENYGAHSEDGKFSSGNHYWKFKPGTTYIVSDAVSYTHLTLPTILRV